jgi:hypothetical protein
LFVTQTVLLNFKPLSWPHVSVATLVPKDPVVVPLKRLPVARLTSLAAMVAFAAALD